MILQFMVVCVYERNADEGDNFPLHSHVWDVIINGEVVDTLDNKDNALRRLTNAIRIGI